MVARCGALSPERQLPCRCESTPHKDHLAGYPPDRESWANAEWQPLPKAPTKAESNKKMKELRPLVSAPEGDMEEWAKQAIDPEYRAAVIWIVHCVPRGMLFLAEQIRAPVEAAGYTTSDKRHVGWVIKDIYDGGRSGVIAKSGQMMRTQSSNGMKREAWVRL